MNNRDNISHIKKLNSETHNIAQMIKAFMEAEQISQSLQIQDEEDRHSIALWGTSKSHAPQSMMNQHYRPSIDESAERMNMTNYTSPHSFLNSTNELPNSLTNRNRDIQSSFKKFNTRRATHKPDEKEKLEELTQRSTNFAPKTGRKSKSVLR